MRDKIMTVLFTAFIFIMLILFMLLPKSDFSANEKRALAKPPEFSVKNVLNGSFETETEDYLTDNLPFRDVFVAANSYFELATGRNGVSGVYKGKDGYLINIPVTTPSFEKNTAAIADFVKTAMAPVTVMIIPTVGAVMEDKLPLNHAPYPDRGLISRAHDKLGKTAHTIDLFSVFGGLKDAEQLY